MDGELIKFFIEKLKADKYHRSSRRSLHERYEWLEAYSRRIFRSRDPINEFASNFGGYYWQLQSIRFSSLKILELAPIGSSSMNFAISPRISQATNYLKLSIIPQEQRVIDLTIEEKSSARNWDGDEFKAVFELIRQIRNNLFHGQKIDIDDQGFARNKQLTIRANNFLGILLANLEQADSFFKHNG